MGTIAKAILLAVMFSSPSFAGERCPPTAPTSAPQQVPDGGSNHNALAIAAVVALGVCIYHKCWQPKPVKAEASLVPEVPQNEYLRIRTK